MKRRIYAPYYQIHWTTNVKWINDNGNQALSSLSKIKWFYCYFSCQIMFTSGLVHLCLLTYLILLALIHICFWPIWLHRAWQINISHHHNYVNVLKTNTWISGTNI